MKIREIPGSDPDHFPSNDPRKVEKVNEANPTRPAADEYSPYDDGSGIKREVVDKSPLGDTVELHTEEPNPTDPPKTE